MTIPVKTTLALIKPDLVAEEIYPEILGEILDEFDIVGMKMLKLSSEEAGKFYSEHKDKSFYPALVEFMSSGPLLALALQGPDAIRRWRGMMGPTDPEVAREKEPNSLRALYGTAMPRNGFHGSDSERAAVKEFLFFFGKDFY